MNGCVLKPECSVPPHNSHFQRAGAADVVLWVGHEAWPGWSFTGQLCLSRHPEQSTDDGSGIFLPQIPRFGEQEVTLC